jgi:hypothetical protein
VFVNTLSKPKLSKHHNTSLLHFRHKHNAFYGFRYLVSLFCKWGYGFKEVKDRYIITLEMVLLVEGIRQILCASTICLSQIAGND